MLVEVKPLSSCSINEVVPDLEARFRGKLVVWQEQVHRGLEGEVDIGSPVGRQEEYARVVLQLFQEQRHELVALHMALKYVPC